MREIFYASRITHHKKAASCEAAFSLHVQNDVRVAPKSFQIVIISFFRSENVDDEVAKIYQHPAAFRVPFDAVGQDTAVFLGVLGDTVG